MDFYCGLNNNYFYYLHSSEKGEEGSGGTDNTHGQFGNPHSIQQQKRKGFTVSSHDVKLKKARHGMEWSC